MKYLVISLLMCLCFGCGDKTKTELYNGYSYKNQQDEKILATSPKAVEKFSNRFQIKNSQLPLFKYIKAPDYYRFIAIPYQITIQELEQQLSKRSDAFNTKQVSDSTLFYVYKNQDELLTEFVWRADSINTFYISTIYNTHAPTPKVESYLKLIQKP